MSFKDNMQLLQNKFSCIIVFFSKFEFPLPGCMETCPVINYSLCRDIAQIPASGYHGTST